MKTFKTSQIKGLAVAGLIILSLYKFIKKKKTDARVISTVNGEIYANAKDSRSSVIDNLFSQSR